MYNVYETGSMTGILGRLKWESLKNGRKDNRLILLYKGLKGKARIPTDDLIPKTRRGRNQHSLAFQLPQTIRDWNGLPESLISSSGLTKKRQEVSRSDKKRHEVSRSVKRLFLCYFDVLQ